MCMHECSESCDEISSYPFPIGNRWAAFMARETKAGAGLGSKTPKLLTAPTFCLSFVIWMLKGL